VGGRDAAKEVNSIAFFFVLIFLIEAFLPFSGAHFNPVVSLVMYLSRTVSAGAMVMFAIVQCLASTLASFLILYLLPEAERMHCSATTVTKDWHNIAGIWKAIFLEAIMTAVLIYVILMTGIHPRSKERSFLSTVSVAATVATLILLGGDLTGTSLNPARSLGPAVACNYWEYQWIYFVGPPAGGVLSWATYALTHHQTSWQIATRKEKSSILLVGFYVVLWLFGGKGRNLFILVL